MAVFAGHGNESSFFSMAFQGQSLGYQNSDAVRDFRKGLPACPIVLMTCLSGNFASAERCLTETMLFAPGGPVAAIGATTESHPLTNALHGIAMARALAAGPARLGDWWLESLRTSYTERNPMFEALLRNAEGSLDPEIDVQQLRRDQMWMYALMGDPATRLRWPGKLKAKIVRDGDKWRWTVEKPPGAERLETAMRAPLSTPVAIVQTKDPAAARADHEKANAMFNYQLLVTLPANQPWEGVVDHPGDLRLLAFGPREWWVAVVKAGE
jgi:hypothetical protein